MHLWVNYYTYFVLWMKICARKPFVIVLLQICAREAQIVLQVYWLLFQYTVTSLFGYNSNIFTATFSKKKNIFTAATFLWLSIHQSISYDTNISIQNAISPYDTNIVCCSIILTFLPQTYLHPKCCWLLHCCPKFNDAWVHHLHDKFKKKKKKKIPNPTKVHNP